MTPDAALVICRFLRDAAAMLVWGGAAYLAVLVPPALANEVARRLRPFVTAVVVVAVAATAATLPVEAALIGDGWSDGLSRAALSGFLFDTAGGTGWVWQAAAALLLLGAVFLPARWRLRATAACAALALVTLALTGHAVMRDGGEGVAQRLNDAVHVLSAGAWFGALVPLVFVTQRLAEPQHAVNVMIALRRFSSAGHVAVALAILTGAANTLFIVGQPPIDWSSPYQALLSAKIAVVAVMVALALANRYTTMPQITGGDLTAIAALRRGTIAEIALGLGAIALVAVFGMLDPAGGG